MDTFNDPRGASGRRSELRAHCLQSRGVVGAPMQGDSETAPLSTAPRMRDTPESQPQPQHTVQAINLLCGITVEPWCAKLRQELPVKWQLPVE